MICAAVVVGMLHEVVLFSHMVSNAPVPPVGLVQLVIFGAAVLQAMDADDWQFAPKPMVPPFVILSQTGVTGVPAQPQPLAVTTSLVVLALPSLQGVPGVAGNAGLFGWQSLLLQTPSPSVSPPRLAHGFGTVPAQPQPSAVTTSLVVLALLSLQAVPGVAG